MASEKQRAKQLATRKKLADAGLFKKRKFVHLLCNSCHKDIPIQTNNASIYTDEVRARFVCAVCK